jgi:hypothetical protein
VALGVELVVVLAEVGDVHEAVDVELVEGHEEAEVRDAGNGAVELVAHVVLHVVALEPGLDVARRLVGAPLRFRAVDADRMQVSRLVALARQHRLDGAVHQQVRIAADGRGEVGVRVVGEAEMPDVLGAVHRLLHRSQHHRLQEPRVGAILDPREEGLVVARLRRVAAAQREREILEHRA